MSETTTSPKTKADLRSMRPMTGEEIERAANADPDAKPFTAAQLARAKHTPRAKLIRRALDITQEEFAAHFQIPLGTLRDWEQGAKELGRANLIVIAQELEAVRRALERRAQEVRRTREAALGNIPRGAKKRDRA
jgi:putative transcriptional regulator